MLARIVSEQFSIVTMSQFVSDQEKGKEKANSTYMFTMKGCFTSFSTVISFRACSTCFNLITSTIERIFKARGVP